MKISVTAETCGNPLDCRLCLERCPGQVFATYPRRRREPGVAAQDWVVVAMLPSQCTGCMECLRFCPKQAISVQ